VTGWQSGDGGQGNWNQPPFGPDPHTNQYGTDPYANQNPYANPYEANPYAGADPYGGQQQQYQYPPTGGFPAPGYGPPPPPPKRSKLPMILSLVAIVIIIGAVVTIVLVNRQDNQPVAQNDPTTTSSSQSKSSPKSSDSTSPGNGEHDDWLSIDNTADSGLTYQVPSDWKQSTETRSSGLGIDFSGTADYGVYDCEGKSYVRTFAASGDVQGKDGKDLDLATTLEDFAKSFGTTYYGADAVVTVDTPKDTKVDGKTAMTVTAKVKQTVTAPRPPTARSRWWASSWRPRASRRAWPCWPW
jgi:hypothetical protein